MSGKNIPLWVRSKCGVAFSNVPTRPGGRMPDFCIIGSAKCGTTSLDKYIGSHPEIFSCALKEPHYFSTQEIWRRGPDWYMGLYADARDDQLCGEASTSYTRSPLSQISAERMYAANPEMKLIYIIRNPVERVKSEALQTLKYMRNVLGIDYDKISLDSFLDMVEDPGSEFYSGIVETSKYEIQISAFEKYFPSSQILILTQGMLRFDVQGTANRVYDFLGLAHNDSVDETQRENTTSSFVDGAKRTRVTSRLRRMPGYNLFKSILPEGVKSSLIGVFDTSSVSEASFRLSDERKAALETILAPHAVATEARLGIPWREW